MAGSRRCWKLRGELSKLPLCGMGSSLRLRCRPFLPTFDPRSNDDAKRHRGVALAYAAGLFPLNSILDRIVALCATGEKDQTACKPGSVRLIAQVWQPFLWDACCQAPHATHPGRGRKTAHARPLFGLAPGGVYRAGPVASPAVGSYPTLSPLPLHEEAAVCFLWHFPSARAGRPLAVALFPWSPDFPPTGRYQPASGCPAVWSRSGI